MPETENEKLAAPVGQDAPVNDVTEVTEKVDGSYTDQPPAVTETSKPNQGGIVKTPFKLRP